MAGTGSEHTPTLEAAGACCMKESMRQVERKRPRQTNGGTRPFSHRGTWPFKFERCDTSAETAPPHRVHFAPPTQHFWLCSTRHDANYWV